MSTTFLVRPSPEKETFRVKLTAASLLGLKLKPGDLCSLIVTDRNITGGDEGLQNLAIAAEASGNGMKNTIVQTSKSLQDVYELKLGDKVNISRVNEMLPDAATVQLVPRDSGAIIQENTRAFWEEYARLTVGGQWECLAQGQKLVFRIGKKEASFEVGELGSVGLRLGRVIEQTVFKIKTGSEARELSVKIMAKSLGGLDKEIQEVQLLVNRLQKPKTPKRYSPVQGLLVYGAKGVGKTAFVETLAEAGWQSIIKWSPGTIVPTPRAPTLIVINQLDLPTSSGSSKPTLRELDKLFTTIRGKPCFVVAETMHPNDVDTYLRSEGKFAAEIEIPIPTATQRTEILSALRGSEPVPDDATLRLLASKTHGYVGADLYALLRRLLELASERSDTHLTNGTQHDSDPPSNHLQPISIAEDDISGALRQIRPSALQQIYLTTPTTRWTDIGGMHAIKRTLINAVTRPLTLSTKMARLALRPKRGVLLYGPPGCSKTLLVKALACEAGLNFLAVKGAELVSMYVGESERAMREIFRKARAASPSIVFFDEIDAIASRKGSGSGSELNVLTTLLNEMDGFEELKNVLVVAATNKPEQLDAALLRPGRFDEVVYIGLPDEETRREILVGWFEKSNYVAREGGGLRDEAEGFAQEMDGFSGAEVVGICQRAAEGALDDGERDWYGWEDVEEARKTTPRSVTEEMVESFETWNAARMR